MMALNEVVRIAADEAGVPPPQRVDFGADALRPGRGRARLKARLTGKDAELSLASVRMMRAEAPVDSSKAKRELGWQPRPVEESIREAARFWAAMRELDANRTGRSRTNRRIGAARAGHVDYATGWCCSRLYHGPASEEVSTMSHPEILEPNAGHPITIEPTTGRVQVRINGELVADTTAALELREATLPAVQYIPLDDVVARPADPHRHRHLLPVQGRRQLLQRDHLGRRHRRRRDLDVRAALPRGGRRSPGTSPSTRTRPRSASLTA